MELFLVDKKGFMLSKSTLTSTSTSTCTSIELKVPNYCDNSNDNNNNNNSCDRVITISRTELEGTLFAMCDLLTCPQLSIRHKQQISQDQTRLLNILLKYDERLTLFEPFRLLWHSDFIATAEVHLGFANDRAVVTSLSYRWSQKDGQFSVSLNNPRPEFLKYLCQRYGFDQSLPRLSFTFSYIDLLRLIIETITGPCNVTIYDKSPIPMYNNGLKALENFIAACGCEFNYVKVLT